MNESEEFREKQSRAEGSANTSPDNHYADEFTGETDRVTGEYHYKNGYTQKIYSDAHYVPADENTVPPRYYNPPQKPAKGPRPPKPPKKKGGTATAVKLICLCLVCALLGGIAGAAIMEGRLSDKIDSIQSSIERTQNKEQLVVGNPVQKNPEKSAALSGSQIYANACQQVVGISSEINFINIFGMTTPRAVSGSGFILSSDGYILTNYHVIEYAYKSRQEASVILHDGTKYPAAIVGVEECNDVAVLKIDAADLTPVTFGDSDNLLVGDRVYAVGNPLGELEFSMSTGHVSAMDRLIHTADRSEPINMFQIDAAVNSGNSGGPVYNDRGQVVGIVTAKYQDAGVEGLGFAIPVNDVISIINDLITKGYVTGKAYMGISLDESYNAMYSQYYNMPLGAYVFSVDVGGAAEAAGIQAGDIITKLDDMEITSPTDLKKAVRQFSAGDTVDVVVYRAGESKTLSICFEDKNAPEKTATPASSSPRFDSM